MISTECLSATDIATCSTLGQSSLLQGRRRKGVALIRFLEPPPEATLPSVVSRFSRRASDPILVAAGSQPASISSARESPHERLRHDELCGPPRVDVLADPEVARNAREHVGLVPGRSAPRASKSTPSCVASFAPRRASEHLPGSSRIPGFRRGAGSRQAPARHRPGS